MRVLHFYKTALPDTMGGVEQVIHQIAKGCSQQGIKTDVLSLTRGHMHSTIEMDGYNVHRAKLDLQIASNGFSISAIWRFFQLAQKADIIHYHYPWPFMDVVHFVTRVKKPTVVTYHSDIIRQKKLFKLYRPLKKRFFASVDRIVATSPNYLKTSYVLENYLNKVSVIPIGLDKPCSALLRQERLAFWRKQLKPKFFLFVGVLRYYKGLHVLLEAAKENDFPIVIVGSGPIESELKAQAAKLGLHNISFLGAVSEEDKVALYTLCFSFVFPSHLRSEAFGISLLEGAMFGKPMISCEIGTGTSFINIGGETGLVVPPSDPDALKKAMRYLWEHPEEAAEMGKKAETRYMMQFTGRQMAHSYAELYADLLDRSNATD